MSIKQEQGVAQAAGTSTATVEDKGLLDQILDAARPMSGDGPSEPVLAERNKIRDLLGEFLKEVAQGSTVHEDTERQINTMIAEIDQKLTDQLNEVLHHKDLQRLEGTWRGLKYLVDRTNSGEMLKIKVLNVKKRDMIKDLEKAGSTERSLLWHKIVESEYGMRGGKPFGMLLGDYEFTHLAEDMFLLQEMSKVSAGGHCPFVAAASPRMFGLDRFDQLTGPDKIGGVFEGVDYAKWRSFRESSDSRYVALTVPRVLARIPYGEETKKVEAFDFEEAVDGRNHDKYLWMNAAWAYAARVTDAFDQDGWLARTRGVEGGGKVDDLPVHCFDTDSGGRAMKCPTEVSMPDWRELELSTLGFLPLQHWKDTDYAAFIGTQTCHRPAEYKGPLGADATANAALSAKLNYMLIVSRFSHYIKAMLSRWLGMQMERDELENKLNMWIGSYVVEDPTKLPEDDRYKYPLQQAKIQVKPVEGQPGWYQAVAHLRPHLHLEGATISMRLVAKMPAAKGG